MDVTGCDGARLAAERRRIRHQAMSIGASVTPFAVAFGAACAASGLPWTAAAAFSVLVFTGGSQFAAVSVLGDGGRPAAAVAAGALLALRSLAYGVVMAPHLSRRRVARMLESHLMIDEAVAVAVGTGEDRLRRYGYLWCGVSVFVLWNLGTLLGVLALRDSGEVITSWGLDATIPAGFLALLWPRLAHSTQRRAALVGALIAAATLPVLPAGLPILAAAGALLVVRERPARAAP
jgi:predicted branched-subunit amino acid permease